MRIIEATGPVGAYIAAGDRRAVLGLILFAPFRRPVRERAPRSASTGVMDRLIAQYDKLAVRKPRFVPRPNGSRRKRRAEGSYPRVAGER